MMTVKKNKITYIKSPMNYVGNKYKYLKQLHEIFPKSINNFIDLFCGGTDVSINTPAITKYANDINTNIIDIYKSFQQHSIEEILSFIDQRIKEFSLSRQNSEGFLQYRELYNTNENYRTPLDLFTLSRFSFNNKISFNINKELNSSFGWNHSDFNLNQRANTRAMHAAIQNINFTSENFRDFDISKFTDPNDFLYIDPPYLISAAQYNTGSKLVNERWELQDDLDLYAFLDNANKQGLKWAMSNIVAHKGQENVALIEWAEQYYVYDIYTDYSKAVYNKIKTNEPTIEVIITNYDKERC